VATREGGGVRVRRQKVCPCTCVEGQGGDEEVRRTTREARAHPPHRYVVQWDVLFLSSEPVFG
jgi:hypothetical protein